MWHALQLIRLPALTFCIRNLPPPRPPPPCPQLREFFNTLMENRRLMIVELKEVCKERHRKCNKTHDKVKLVDVVAAIK
jgi:hypothetical protein